MSLHTDTVHTPVDMPQLSIYLKAGQPSGKGQNLLFCPYWESLLAQGKYVILHYIILKHHELCLEQVRLRDCN